MRFVEEVRLHKKNRESNQAGSRLTSIKLLD
jgi:hypothetical protein